MNAVYLYVCRWITVAASTRVAADLADTPARLRWRRRDVRIVMLSSFGGLAGIVLAGPRVYYAMAHDGLLFKWFGDLHPRYRHAPSGDRAAGHLVVAARGDRDVPGALHPRGLHRVAVLRARWPSGSWSCESGAWRDSIPFPCIHLRRCSSSCRRSPLSCNALISNPKDSCQFGPRITGLTGHFDLTSVRRQRFADTQYPTSAI